MQFLWIHLMALKNEHVTCRPMNLPISRAVINFNFIQMVIDLDMKLRIKNPQSSKVQFKILP